MLRVSAKFESGAVTVRARRIQHDTLSPIACPQPTPRLTRLSLRCSKRVHLAGRKRQIRVSVALTNDFQIRQRAIGQVEIRQRAAVFVRALVVVPRVEWVVIPSLRRSAA